MGKIQVRLKPYDYEKGHTARAMGFAAIGGVTFEDGKIVDSIDGRPISKTVAAFLKAVHMKPDDESTPLAFDVLDEREMEKVIAAEARKRLNLSPEVMAALRDEFGRGDGALTEADLKPAPAPEQPYRRTRRVNGIAQSVAAR